MINTQSVRLTNGETIKNVLEVQFSADGSGILQIDVTDHAARFGVQGLLNFFKGRIEHVYVWHLANAQLCHTKVYGAETSQFDNQLAEIENELKIAHGALAYLKHHVSGAIARGEAVAIVEHSVIATITEVIRDIKHGDCTLSATFSDGSTRKLFNFYIDELSFSDFELIGKTETEAQDLHRERDSNYLRS